jgi:UDP-N-acetylmuramoylalanine--D-glutamate ligase
MRPSDARITKWLCVEAGPSDASVLIQCPVGIVAGGMLKGASVTATVARVAGRLAGAVLIGRDRAVFAEALSRHAPDVPVIHVVTREDAGMHEANESGVTSGARVITTGGPGIGRRVMAEAVAAAAELARPGETVLLAPAGASFDQFSGYADRGDAFAEAVRARAGRRAR